MTAACKPTELAVCRGYSLLSGLADFHGTEPAKRSYSAVYSLERVPAAPPEAVAMAVCVTARVG